MGTTIEVEHVISRLTVEDQTIFDPMMGSGTTGLQRFKINRKFIGMEIRSDKFEIAKIRIQGSDQTTNDYLWQDSKPAKKIFQNLLFNWAN